MTFSGDLVTLTDDYLQAIEASPVMQAMLTGQVSRQGYIDFLVRLYPVVSNFCPMMSATLGVCADRLPELRRFLHQHIQEERGHEHMVLNDLRALGMADVDSVPQRRPALPAQAIIAFNYHGIRAEHPGCVLGMIYVLEILSSLYAGKVALAVSRTLGLAMSSGFSFLDSHATLDEDHMASLRKLLQLEECAESQSCILNSIGMNFYLFKELLEYGVGTHSGATSQPQFELPQIADADKAQKPLPQSAGCPE
ncbi:MAG: hypothetical protein RL404_48 [Pseudomonadota bacterium]|jgi:pyrroloquinoline quinone (PQQ) biosynthesis protein C